MKYVVAIDVHGASINDLVDSVLTSFTLVIEQRHLSLGIRTILGNFNWKKVFDYSTKRNNKRNAGTSVTQLM